MDSISSLLKDALPFATLAITAWLGWLYYKATDNLPRKSHELETAKILRQQRETIFRTIMAYRGQNYTRDTLIAFNLIDVTFYDDQNVRNAWRDYYAVMKNPHADNASGYVIQADKLKTLLSTMASSLGLSGGISSDDFDRVYITRLIEAEDIVSVERTKAQLTLIMEAGGAANTAAPVVSSSGKRKSP